MASADPADWFSPGADGNCSTGWFQRAGCEVAKTGIEKVVSRDEARFPLADQDLFSPVSGVSVCDAGYRGFVMRKGRAARELFRLPVTTKS